MDEQQREATETRLALLDALAAAHERFGEVMDAIADAADGEAATDALVDLLGLPERYLASVVLDMQLRRRTAQEQARVRAERDEVRALLTGG